MRTSERRTTPDRDMTNLYSSFFEAIEPTAAAALTNAALTAANAYLDGKPSGAKVKINRARRDAEFWSCPIWAMVPIDCWRSGVMTLALARYFAQEDTSNPDLLERLAAGCPAVLDKAVRNSGIVLSAAPLRRAELEWLGRRHLQVAELCRTLYIFSQAHADRLNVLAAHRAAFEQTTPFELLVLASLYAFEHLVPRGMASPHRAEGVQSDDQEAWRAINDVFLWKLERAEPKDFALGDDAIASVLVQHVAPVLRSEPGHADSGTSLHRRFQALLAAQIELNAFVSQSADAFSYNDGIRFVPKGTSLEIVEVDASLRAAWQRDGRKLARLHEYWFYRGLADFMQSGRATETIGRPENHEANRLAYVRAMRTRLQLSEVYGVADTVTTDGGERVDVFQASLSMELMAAFYQRDFLEAFMGHLRTVGDWRMALRKLCEGGVLSGMQNRLPLTWSDRAAKISNIVGWTVTAAAPQGDPAGAAAILDFWSSDWSALSAQMKAGSSGLRPELLERPVLKFGEVLVQLPWHAGLQNNSTAIINNLRRLGQRRGEAREETQRIETGLARALEARGFVVVANWLPDRALHGDAGEIDLVCALEDVVLVVEVKSTFIRKSHKEAFQHATSTLRHAGRQVLRKAQAVARDLRDNGALRTTLRLDTGPAEPALTRWIVDTSIECDHQRFSGVLKVSLEEVLIALRDDAALLRDPGNLFLADPTRAPGEEDPEVEAGTLYPHGFSARRFIEVVEQGDVWQDV
ncbi:hypothetical protein [Variovorax sp. GT1P44]|uniref:hypothetical protein n=1 Tax=Variovorax sp. GT1P44 TaxID=3443742 RepID=UPI003F45885C